MKGDSSAKNKQEAEPDEDGVFGSVEEKVHGARM